MDRISKRNRSQVMASVKSSGTRLEARLADALNKAHVVRFDRNPRNMDGHPDFVFTARKVAIFVDSCFWHGCRWHCRMPTSNLSYWNAKMDRNRARDKEVTRKLRQQGWSVLRIWEHSLNEPQRAVTRIKKALEKKQGKANSLVKT